MELSVRLSSWPNQFSTTGKYQSVKLMMIIFTFYDYLVVLFNYESDFTFFHDKIILKQVKSGIQLDYRL